MSKQGANSISNELLARYFAGEANQEESLKVTSWAEASQENRELFNRCQVIWQDTGVIRVEQQQNQEFDVDAAWKKVKSGREVVQRQPAASRIWRVAAAAIIVLGISWLVQIYMVEEEYVQLVAESSIEEVKLSDNSVITLNGNSVLSYPETFHDDTRTVKLTGEAFFEVNHRPEKPFIVELGETHVKVLGTSFNISSRMDKDTVAVWVETGKVLFYSRSNDVVLSAGQKGFYVKSKQALFTATTESVIGTEQFWRTRRLDFSGQTLSEVAESISLAYGVNITLENEAVRNCRLAVTFEDESLEDVLGVIELTLNLSIRQQNGVIIIGGAGCPE